MTPFPLRFRGHQPNDGKLYPIGILYFHCSRKPSSSFFILWGVQLTQLEMSEPSSTLGRSWWDESEPACAVLAWEDVTDTQLNEPGEQHPGVSATSYLLQRYARHRIHEKITLRGWPSPCQEVTTADGISVRARISAVDFLDRRGLRLVVDVSMAESTAGPLDV